MGLGCRRRGSNSDAPVTGGGGDEQSHAAVLPSPNRIPALLACVALKGYNTTGDQQAHERGARVDVLGLGGGCRREASAAKASPRLCPPPPPTAQATPSRPISISPDTLVAPYQAAPLFNGQAKQSACASHTEAGQVDFTTRL